MKLISVFCAALLLSACATPQRVVDTAALVAKMSTGMNRSVQTYVGSLNAARKLDEVRLQGYGAAAEQRRAQQTMKPAGEARLRKTLNELPADLAPVPDPMRSAQRAPVIAGAPLSFDGAPLQNLARIASDIAQPSDASEQLSVLLKFANEVNADLAKAAKDGTSSTP